MAEAGVPPEHISKVANHIDDRPAAILVSGRYAYDAEKREAVECWARRLQRMVEGEIAKVVAMPARQPAGMDAGR